MSQDRPQPPERRDETRAGPSPGDLAALNALAEQLIQAALATRRSEAFLVHAQARHLAWLSEGDRPIVCGFSSISALALEDLGLSPRTTRERLSLHRLFTRFPAAERAFLEGRMSACQALAVAPILSQMDGDNEASVTMWIETACCASVRSLRYEARSRRGAGSARTPDPAAPLDPSAPDAIDPDGRMITFSAPVGFQVAFDQTMDLARKVLGRDAPIHECIAAILAEANWTGVGLLHQDHRWVQPPKGISICPRAKVPIRPDAIRHARRTLEQVHAYIKHVLDLADSAEPGSPHDALDRLRQIRRLRAPQRVIFAHIIRDLRRTYAMDLLGYRSMADLAEDRLGFSERSARNRVAESLLFESDEEIEEAVGRGEISLMQAHLVRRLRHGGESAPFIDRARRLTWVQLLRECRLLELLRKCGLGRVSYKPLPQSRIEDALIEALGGNREEIEGRLRLRGIPPLPSDGAPDPAENSILMDRLEALVEMFASTMWGETPQIARLKQQEANEQEAADSGPDRQVFAASLSQDEGPDPTSDPIAAPSGLTAGYDLDRQMSAAHESRVTIRFWAPHPTADDFQTVVTRFRRRSTPQIPTWAAVVFLFAQVTEDWNLVDPERRPTRAATLERDNYRCAVPGCNRRSQLVDHHLEYLSQGGGNEPTNRSILCHPHHAHGVHMGRLRIKGKAPYALRFELGCRPDGPPVMILIGQKKVI